MGLLVIFLFLLLLFFSVQWLILRKEVKHFSEDIDCAMEGKLSVISFDEREMSKVKSKLLKFSYANQVKESELIIERNKTRDFIADISHQTKTPISNLVLYTDLLEQDYCKEYLHIVKYELNKLEFLIETLVKSSRLESDIIVLQKCKVPLVPLVKEVLNELSGLLQEKNMSISCHYEECCPELDERWIKEAIHNLLENAIKYSPENSIIHLSVYPSYLHYNLDIENDCDGLSSDDLPKLYQRFYRGKNSLSKEGLGLGLYIVKEIVEKHGGTIEASLQNNRIKFSLDFPL